jgi:predicted MFS family arabinose efflux permease
MAARLESRVRELVAPLSERSIRRLWYARLFSNAGDWAARIALSLLVFHRTGSPLAATAVTVVSLLPHVGIGQLLGTLADRFPHRTVMVVSDVVRGLLYLLLAVADLPVPYALALAFLAGLGDPPFMAAHSAALPQLAGDRYLATQTVFIGTSQAMTLVGFAAGGLLAAVVGPAAALGLNGASFLVSVVLVAGIRPTRSSDSTAARPYIRPAVRALTRDPLIRIAALVVTVGTILGIAVESLMVAYAAHLGLGPAGTGLLASVPPLAAIATALLLPSNGEHVRLVRLVCRTVTVMTLVAFVIFALDSPLPLVLVGFIAAGSLDVMTVPAGAVIGQRLPRATRGTAFSFLEGALKLSHAVGALLAGVLASLTTVPSAVALLALPACAAGALGLVALRSRLSVAVAGDRRLGAPVAVPTD